MKKIISITALSLVLGLCNVGIGLACEHGECQTDLIAGQDWYSPAGVLTVQDNGKKLYITLETYGDWIIEETHLYVGLDAPVKSAPGRFPFALGGQTEYVIPLGGLVGCGDILYIAAHSVVSQDGLSSETAWADSYGIPFGKGWAMYFKYEVCNGCVEVEQ